MTLNAVSHLATLQIPHHTEVSMNTDSKNLTLQTNPESDVCNHCCYVHEKL